jgi:alpha-ribazole phosphatase
MWKTLCLSRHGMTAGNQRSNYIGGRTDESLCRQGAELLKKSGYPPAEYLFLSPMKRCMESAGILYPDLIREGRFEICEGFRECDFGRFEGRSWQEMSGEKEYQDWIASGGMGKFPGGEDPKDFIKRCADTFEDCADRFLLSPGMPDSAAALVHGGTLMSILSVFGDRSKAYYDWHVPCGGGFRLLLDRELWEKGGGIRSVEKLFPDGEPD